MFYYQEFQKAVWINKAAVSLNYQYIKMYLWTTKYKNCLAELLFSALFQGEKGGVLFKRVTLEMQTEQANIPECTVTIRGCAVSRSEGSLPHDLEPNTLGISGPMQQQQGWCVGYHMSRR